MSFTNEDVVKALGHMTVMELIKLTKELEAKWGLEAKPQVSQFKAVPQETTKVVEQSEFNVFFVSYPADKKMTLVKLIRELLGLGLLESKNLVEGVVQKPALIKEGVSKEEAENLKAKITEAGGSVEIK